MGDQERQMIDLGRRRYERAASAMRDRGQASKAPPEWHALKHAMEPFEKAIKVWYKESTTGPGRHADAAVLVKGLKPHLLAFLAGRAILNNAHGGVKILSAALAVAREIEDEVHLALPLRDAQRALQRERHRLADRLHRRADTRRGPGRLRSPVPAETGLR